jgi:transposase-like protein
MSRGRPAKRGFLDRVPSPLSSPRKKRQQENEEPNIQLTLTNMQSKLFEKPSILIYFLQNKGLLIKSIKCCNNQMILVERTSVIDLCLWRCQFCKKETSIRINSFFSRSKLSLKEIIIICYCWFNKIPMKLCEREASLGYGVKNGGRNTIIDWYNFCRDVCRESLYETGDMIGGENKIVEIDESAFGKRKYNRGSRRNTYWVFGGVERISNKCFLVPVKRRTRRTLWPIIFKYVRPGSTIISDCWRAYTGLNGINRFIHQTVNHTENYVDPNTGACTNTCEGSWFHVKRSLPSHGTRKKFLANYFAVSDLFILNKKLLFKVLNFFFNFRLLYGNEKSK